MKRYIFLTILAFLTSGCIPKYVDQRPNTLPVTKPVISTTAPQSVQKETATVTQTVTQPTTIVEPTVTTTEPTEVIEEQENSKSYKVTMKTKKFAFSDTGFLVKYKNSLNLNVLAMGKSVLDLKIKVDEDDICVGSLCNTKHGFNQSFLVGSYPDEFIENVLQKKPIFNSKHLTKTPTGFIQQIICDRYGIKYQVTNKGVYFKDKKNNILIKLREIK